jgi:hypothetical protein
LENHGNIILPKKPIFKVILIIKKNTLPTFLEHLQTNPLIKILKNDPKAGNQKKLVLDSSTWICLFSNIDTLNNHHPEMIFGDLNVT